MEWADNAGERGAECSGGQVTMANDKLKMTKTDVRITNYQLLIFSTLVAMASLIFLTLPAHAQGPNLDDETNRLAKSLYCPVCPNTPLDVCNTQACVQWRAQIKEMLVSGKSEEQIRDYFISQYGDRVLGAPPAEGFNWLAYILPVVGVVLGGTIAWFALRNRLTRGGASSPEAMPISSEYASRIEEELKEE